MHKNNILPFLAIFGHFQPPEIGQKWKMKQKPKNYLILIYLTQNWYDNWKYIILVDRNSILAIFGHFAHFQPSRIDQK